MGAGLSPQAVLIVILGASIWFGAIGIWHGVKKVAHKAHAAIEHVIHPHHETKK